MPRSRLLLLPLLTACSAAFDDLTPLAAPPKDPQLPAPCPDGQLLRGSLRDEAGADLAGVIVARGDGGGGGGGGAEVEAAADGSFSFCAPAGAIDVSLRLDGPVIVDELGPIAWQGGELDLVLPTAVPLFVRVTTDDGAPVEHAEVRTDAALTTSSMFGETLFSIAGAFTGGDGEAVLYAWPTAERVRVEILTYVGGVRRVDQLELDVGAGASELVLPTPPPLLNGVLRDTAGRVIAGNGHALNLMVRAQNDVGEAQTRVDPAGRFYYFVPEGSVGISLSSPAHGFFSKNEEPNPFVPYLVENISPSVRWSMAEGPITLTLPAVAPLTVRVTVDGQPLVGAEVGSSESFTTPPFTLHTRSETTTTARFQIGTAQTDEEGAAVFSAWPTDTGSMTLTIRASVGTKGIHTTVTVPADGQPHDVTIDL